MKTALLIINVLFLSKKQARLGEQKGSEIRTQMLNSAWIQHQSLSDPLSFLTFLQSKYCLIFQPLLKSFLRHLSPSAPLVPRSQSIKTFLQLREVGWALYQRLFDYLLHWPLIYKCQSISLLIALGMVFPSPSVMEDWHHCTNMNHFMYSFLLKISLIFKPEQGNVLENFEEFCLSVHLGTVVFLWITKF